MKKEKKTVLKVFIPFIRYNQNIYLNLGDNALLIVYLPDEFRRLMFLMYKELAMHIYRVIITPYDIDMIKICIYFILFDKFHTFIKILEGKNFQFPKLPTD